MTAGPTAGRWELGQTHVTEQVFGQKAEWIEFRVWRMRVPWRGVATFTDFCPAFRPEGEDCLVFPLFSLFTSNSL